jgi:Pyruvate/2-oxoacid:ferredoxin oxidoreductase gamma subunit
MRRTEIRNAGFGGQGVLLSATIIGKAACVFQKYYATMTQNSGPETGGVRVSFSGPFPVWNGLASGSWSVAPARDW